MRAALVALGLFFVGCMPPPPGARAADAARELNLAARFGRMDIALERTAPGARSHFLTRRSDWGKGVRVVDVEVTGLEMQDKENALIYVDVSWVRIEEGSLRMTRLAQRWQDIAGWQLVRERRAGGDLGLFGEAVVVLTPEPRGDVHFPSRTIR